jgi:hypothetical protein
MVMSKQSNDIVKQWEEQKQMEKEGDPFKRIVKLLNKQVKGKQLKGKKPKKKK